MNLKNAVCTAAGVIGGFMASAFGGWDAAIVTLVVCMAADYISGLVTAGVFHASKKSGSGALESRAGFKGLCRKGMTLLVVLIACRLELILGVGGIREAVIIGFTANEVISIVENAGLMGVPMPAAVTKALDVLTGQAAAGGRDEM